MKRFTIWALFDMGTTIASIFFRRATYYFMHVPMPVPLIPDRRQRPSVPFLCRIFLRPPATGQDECHLGIIRRLSGNRFPSSPVNKVANAVGIFTPNVFRCSELHQAAKSVTGKLTKQSGKLSYTRSIQNLAPCRFGFSSMPIAFRKAT